MAEVEKQNIEPKAFEEITFERKDIQFVTAVNLICITDTSNIFAPFFIVNISKWRVPGPGCRREMKQNDVITTNGFYQGS